MNVKITVASTFVFAIWLSFAAQSQDSLAIKYAYTITEQDLKEHLTIIASDAMGGRDTGSPGQKMAATYIEEDFRSNQLNPVVRYRGTYQYLQDFFVTRTIPGETWLEANGIRWINHDMIYYEGNENFPSPRTGQGVFIGDGSSDLLEQIDLNGKVAIGLSGSAEQTAIIDQSARAHGAIGIIIILDTNQIAFEKKMHRHERLAMNARLSFAHPDPVVQSGTFFVPPSIGSQILDEPIKNLRKASQQASAGRVRSIKNIDAVDIRFMASRQEEIIDTENVLGLVEGSDKKDEVIVITAHYDHVGTNGNDIYNGADDDGSGTAAVMEIAEAFAEAQRQGYGPRRSLLFMTVSGEERGLLGSDWYTRHPVLSLDKTVANLNIDMIGRVDPAHTDNENYIYLIGSDRLSTELHRISESANDTYTKLNLDYKYNDKNDPNRFYYRSDHYNFAKHGIPCIFYFNGTHEDYHRPTDTIDKINFPLLKRRTQLIFHTAWELANSPDRVALD